MKTQIRFVILFIVLTAAAIWGISYYRHITRIMETDDAQIEGDIYPIIPKISGYVINVPVRDNQDVKKGDLLLEIDPVDFENWRVEARAALEAARASYQAASSQVQQFESEAESGRVNLKKSARDLTRYQALADKEEISRQQLEEAERVNASNQAKLGALERQIEATRAQVKLMSARIAEAAANLKNTELQVGYTRITSPVSGKISKKSIQPGQWVQPGQSMMAVVPLSDVWVVANYKETQLTHMRPGQEAIIRVDTYPGKLFHGKIESIAPGTGARFSLLPTENATGNFVKVVQRVPVKIVISADDLKAYPEAILRPGMNVAVQIDISRPGS
ncbi:MAG TPA: HlyD family secretion protein [Nitrospiria bacterium]|nr:HlyD family secretion protein [Nitrospiria bacterium]